MSDETQPGTAPARCSVLEPPHTTPIGIETSRFPLGSILIARASDPGAVAQAVVARGAAPWCPLCLLTTAPNSPQVAPSPRLGDPRWLAWAAESAPPDEIITAVRARPAPTPADIAGYVADRLQAPEVIPVLRSALGESGAWAGHRTTAWRHFTKLGSLRGVTGRLFRNCC